MKIDADIPDFCAASTAEKRCALAERQLARLAAREAVVQAFACHDAGAARKAIAGHPGGPLGGALLGVKDIIATADFPTLYGASDCEDQGPRIDAWCVARARRLGAIVLGKTVCTEFGFPRPGPTTNPHDARRTPGGSSSGSAAAVAAGFVSFALGSQTAGSTIRPASFCGITGYKPSHGFVHTEGVQALSMTLDHVGLFTLTPRDAWYFASAVTLKQAEIIEPKRPDRLLVLRPPAELPQADSYPERLAALAACLRNEGIDVHETDLPFPIEDFCGLQKKLCYWEAARILLAPKKRQLSPDLRAQLQPYLDSGLAEYMAARRRRQSYQAQFEELCGQYEAAAMPAALGAAPPSLADTGDAVMNRFWTALHIPVFSVPLWRSAEGMPLGLQLLGRLGADRELAALGQWLLEHCS
jgi:Asp-tRNA(Asn)/Glu-tRNA(Gln) amidotransferase A subunit family amidase